MTKIEYGKCEKMMHRAIYKAQKSKEGFKEAYILEKNDNVIKAEVATRGADQDYGEAVGIDMVLRAIGFEHEDMKLLERLL